MMARARSVGLCWVIASTLVSWSCAGESERPPSLEHRVAALRLSGQERYLPCLEYESPDREQVECRPVTVDGGPANERLAQLGHALRRQGETRRPPDLNLVARWGLLFRTPSSVDYVIEMLRANLQRSPEAVDVRNDLGVAFVTRFELGGNPESLFAALGAFDRVVTEAPRHQAALFNRAYLLGRIGLRSQAMRGWSDYLAAAGARGECAIDLHGWEGEACRRLGLEQEMLVPERWATLVEADATSAEAWAKGLVALAPGLARDHVYGELLPAWAARRADSQLPVPRKLVALGDALLGTSGDREVHDVVATITRATPSDRDKLARAHSEYAAAVAARAQLACGEVTTILARLRTLLAETASPLELRADLLSAACAYTMADLSLAKQLYTDISESAQRLGYFALDGMARRGLGLLAAEGSDLAVAREFLSQAAVLYGSAREHSRRAGALVLTAEIVKLAGEPEQYWALQVDALTVLRSYGPTVRLHQLLWDMGDSVRQAVGQGAARYFHDEDVAVGEALDAPWVLVEALQKRAGASASGGDVENALADLAAAGTKIEAVPAEIRMPLLAAIAEVRASVLSRIDPGAAVVAANLAVTTLSNDAYRPRLMRALQVRAAAKEAADDVGGAAEDLERAISIGEAERSSLRSAVARIQHAERITAVYDAAIDLELARESTVRALELLERSRDVLAGGGASSSAQRAGFAEWLRREAAAMPAERLIVVPAVLEKRVVVWSIGRQGVAVSVSAIPPGAAAADVREFRRAVRRGVVGAAATAAGRRIADLLLETWAANDDDAEVVLVLDKFFNGLPAAALPFGDGMLVEQALIAFAPTLADAFGAAAAVDPNAAVLVVAPAPEAGEFPELPFAGVEAVEIGRMYDSSIIQSGAEATRANFSARLPEARMLHFAGHAVHRPETGDTHLVLSDGRLDVRDLFEQSGTPLSLVTLAACHSVSAATSRTGGLATLAAPFIAAGAGVVVGTLWEIDDSAAGRLFADIHKLTGGGVPPVEAVRRVQMAAAQNLDGNLQAWASIQVVIGSNQ